MKKRSLVLLLIVFLLFGPINGAFADLIFNNYGPDPGYKTSGPVGFLIGPNPNYPSIVNVSGTLFVPTATAYLNNVEVPIWNSSNDATPMQFYLVTIDRSLPTYNYEMIETFSLTLGSSGSMSSYTMMSQINPLLTAGNEYWLVASSTGNVGWIYTTSNDTSVQLTSFDGGSTWSYHNSEIGRQMAMRVNGSTVPVPGAAWLLCSGLLAFFGIRRFRF
jgi:hypothetical protein